MHSSRYGSLSKISRRTDHRCHLCHEEADLAFYGPTGAYGDDTVTVDHVFPQAFGGDDDDDNLLIAHGTCNSRRGLRPVEDARLDLAGTTSAPWSRGERLGGAVLAGSSAALLAGSVFARPKADGTKEFNGEAAALAALFAAVLVAAAT